MLSRANMRDGVRCEDLQRLTYPDDYFDIVLTSETLEDVPDPGQGLARNLPYLKRWRLSYLHYPGVTVAADYRERERIL